jgi:antitoxin YefM
MRVISFTKARNNLKSVLDAAAEDADATVITRRDAGDAVVMSLDHYNGLMETLHLLQSPANAAHLRKSIEQYRAGEATKHELHDG